MKVQHVRLKAAALLVFIVASFGIFGYLFTKAGGRVETSKPYRVKVLVPEPFQLVKNSDVRASGVKVGFITDIADATRAARLTIQLDKSFGPLRRSTRVAVRTKTLVGENYLELLPGSPSAAEVPNGATVPVTQASEAVPVDRVLDTLDKKTRKEVTQNIRTLGDSFNHRGDDLNASLATLKPLSANARAALGILSVQRGRVASLVDGAGRVLTAIGSREQAVRALVVDSRRTAVAVSDRDQAIAAMLDRLPGTLRQARSSLGVLADFSRQATPVVGSLRRGMVALAPAARDLQPAATDADRIVGQLDPVLKRADVLLPAVQKLSKKLPGFSRGTEATLRQANPFLGFVKPYTNDMTSFFANMGGIFKTDAFGYIANVKALIGPKSLKTFDGLQKKAYDALVASTAFGQLSNERANSYAEPGTIGNEQEYDGSYQPVGAEP